MWVTHRRGRPRLKRNFGPACMRRLRLAPDGSFWMPGSDKGCQFREWEYILLMAVSSPDLKAFLVATPLFGGLSDASLDLLISKLVERSFEVGAIVVAEGEPGR